MASLSEWVKSELHFHTGFSNLRIGPLRDCTTPLADILSVIINKSLHIVAPTDHDPIDFIAGETLQHMAEDKGYLLTVIPSAEVTSREKRDHHILAFGLEKPIPRHLSLKATVDAIHDQKALAVPAHLFHFYSVTLRQLRDNFFDAVEIHDAGAPSWLSFVAVALISRSICLPRIAGSDAHLASEVGRAQTLFPPGTQTIAEVLNCIKTGNIDTINKSSPYLINFFRVILAGTRQPHASA